MMKLRIVLATAALAVCVGVASAEEQTRVSLVEDLGLPSAARALIDSGGPAVHYNPLFLERLPSRLALFAMLHEEAHVLLGHPLQPADSAAATSDIAEREPAVLRRQELAADCGAASRLAARAPDVLASIVAYFTEMGDYRPSEAFPTGKERAQILAQCARSPVPRLAD